MIKLPSSLFAFLWHIIKQQKWLFLLMVICHLAWAVDQTVFPYVFKEFLDRILAFTGDKADIWPVVMGPVLLGAVIWLLTILMFRIFDLIVAVAIPRFEAAIRMSVTDYVQQHSFNYFAENFAGRIANKISDLTSGASTIVRLSLTLFIPTIVAFIIGISIFMTVQPVFAFLTLAWFVIHLAISLYFSNQCNKQAVKRSESRSLLTGKLVDMFTNINNIAMFSRHRWEMDYAAKFQEDERRKFKKLFIKNFNAKLAMDVAHFPIMGALFVWMMVVNWQSGAITAAELVYVFYTSWGSLQHVRNLPKTTHSCIDKAKSFL